MMNRQSGNSAWRKEEPPDKKRRMEEKTSGDIWGDDDWDETDFTDDQLEKFDDLCSQALNEKPEPQKNFAKPKTAVPTVAKQKTFTFNSSGKSSQGSVSTSKPKVQTNMSYPLSSGNKPKPSYPSVLAPSKPKSYQQPKSGTDVNHNRNFGTQKPVTSISNSQTFGRQTNTPGLGSNLSVTSSTAQPVKPPDKFVESLRQELKKVKEENEIIKKQMQSEKDEHYSKDGQIKMLRESLSRKETELFKQKQDRSKEIDEKVHDYKERERTLLKKENNLVQEIEKLKAALQFKEHEISEAQTNLKKLEQRTLSPIATMSPSQRSPRPGKRSLPEAKKSPETPKSAKTAFPSRRSFMSTESGGEKVTPPAPPVMSLKKEVMEVGPGLNGSPLATSSAKSSMVVVKDTAPKRQLRNYALKVANSKGAVCGRHLMAQLVDHHEGVVQSEGDLVTLLNNRTTTGTSPPKVREPAPAGTRTRLRSQSGGGETEKEVDQVEAKCCQLAKTGINRLLSHSSNQNTDSTILSCQTSGACDLLPIIETSVKNYLEYQTEKDLNIKSSTPNSSKSLSYEGSLDSVSSSLRNLELTQHLTVKSVVDTALRILYKLVCYSQEVRDFLLTVDGDVSLGCERLGSGGDQATEMNGPKPVTSSNRGGGGGDTQILTFTGGLLHLLFKLAAPSISREKPENLDTTELTLKILTMLARLSSGAKMEKFLPLLGRTTLSKCLGLTSEPAVIIRTVELMEAISTSYKVVTSFCKPTASTCLFIDVYNVCLACNKEWTMQEHTAVCEKVVNFLWAVVSHHKKGATLLLESDCSCSVEVVKSLVIILNDEMVHYKSNAREQSQHVIVQGIKLLHIFCLRDHQFADHWAEIELQYTSFISSMSLLCKQTENPDEAITMAIQDLWDVDEAFLQGEEDESSPETS